MMQATKGRPRKSKFSREGSCKTCTRCKEEKRLGQFPPHQTTLDGHSPWCHDCHRSYSIEHYHKKKHQPAGDELCNDREPKSDAWVERRNRELYRQQREQGKRECAEAGCITRLNRWQKDYCLMHESQRAEARLPEKLKRAKAKKLAAEVS